MTRAKSDLLPLYHRIFLVMRDKLFAGEYPADQALPGEIKLAEEFDVSRATIRKALALLEAEGFVRRRQGAGTWPTGRGKSSRQTARNLESVTRGDGLYRDVFRGEVETHIQTIPANAELNELFGDYDEFVRITRKRTISREPHSYIVSFLPPDLAANIDLHALGNTPLYAAIETAGHKFARVDQRVAATTANETLAVELGLPLGTVLLKVSGLFRDKSGRCLMSKDGFFLADGYGYETTINIG